ncbi:uncharacterized protein LOC142159396 isoform X2 [Mixophyes fleayi]|uniref:uncharacterized protein LOC142159396 isoform X2 n=1 Tax=Mixophyes fleayi TaxID=3061075 RepID=UPI003F4E0DC6
MASSSTYWWLRVLFLAALHRVCVSVEEVTSRNDTYTSNVTTGPDPLYTTREEATETPITVPGTETSHPNTYTSNVTTGPDPLHTTREEATETPITVPGTETSHPNTYTSNVTTGPDPLHTTREETTETPITVSGTETSHPNTYTSNVTTGPDPLYTTREETTEIPITVPATETSHPNTYTSNVTTGPDPLYTTREETTEIPITVPATETSHPNTYTSNVTTGPDPLYTTREETTETPITVPGTETTHPNTYTSNVTTGPDPLYTTREETTEIPITVPATETSHPNTYTSNVTTGPDPLYTTREETTETPITVPGTETSHPNTYTSNVTTGPDLLYITREETTETPITVPGTETSHPNTYTSNVTTGPDLLYTTREETNETPITVPGTETFHPSAASCTQDTDCPPFSACTDRGALRTCRCDLGYYYHNDLGCVTVRTFPARVSLSFLLRNQELQKTLQHGRKVEEKRQKNTEEIRILHDVRVLFQDVFGHMTGYLSTSVADLQLADDHMTIIHSFSMLYAVTEENLRKELTHSPLLCMEGNPGCISPLTGDTYQSLSLCDFVICDPLSSECVSHAGLVTCVCRHGYYRYSPTDRTCRACASGFQWTENRCERCPLGFGGFNCDESFLLAVIVESCLGLVLLASFITLLVYYFRKKKEKPQPRFMDSIVLGVPPDQHVLRLPRAQFSWRREWEWNDPPGKTPTDVQQERTAPDDAVEAPGIQMKTFGEFARSPAANPYGGSHNLAFISDN